MKTGWGQRLKEARGDLSQAAFAEKMDVGRSVWADYEREIGTPRFDTLLKLKAATGVSLDWLATGQGPKSGGFDREALVTAIKGAMQIVDSARKSGKREYTPEEIGDFVADIYASMIKTPIDENKSAVQSLGVPANEEAPDAGHRKTRA